MKILIANTTFYPKICGPTIAVANLAESFVKKGHEVTIYCSGDKIKKKEVYKGARVIRFKRPEKRFKGKIRSEKYQENLTLGLELLKKDYDLILVKNHLFLEELKKRYAPSKIIWSVSSLMNFSEKFYDKKKISKNVEEIKKLTKGIKIIFLTKKVKEQFRKRIREKRNIGVIPNGVNVKKFSPGGKKEETVLYLGRLEREKNPLSAVKAFIKIKNTSSRLSVVGGGSLKKRIRSYSKKYKRIKIFGETNAPEFYYKKSKIFLLPSIYESFGNVLIEAMSSGLPCIAFKPDGKNIITSSDEVIKNNYNGFLVKDEGEMAEKIDLLLSDNALWKKMSLNSIKESRKYSWEKCAEKIINFSKSK
jgi:glycosyltransferase involved in cell wall biosynthesis